MNTRVRKALNELCDRISPATLRREVVVPIKAIFEDYQPTCYSPSTQEETMEEVVRFVRHFSHQRYCKACDEWPLELARMGARDLVAETFSSGPLHRLGEIGAHRVAADDGIQALLDILSNKLLDNAFETYMRFDVLLPIQLLTVESRYDLAEEFMKALPRLPGVEFMHPAIFKLHFEDAIWHHARLALSWR